MEIFGLSARLKKIGDVLVRIDISDASLKPFCSVEIQKVDEKGWPISSRMGQWSDFTIALVTELFDILAPDSDTKPTFFLILTPDYIYFPVKEDEGIVGYETKVAKALTEAISTVFIRTPVITEAAESKAETK